MSTRIAKTKASKTVVAKREIKTYTKRSTIGKARIRAAVKAVLKAA